MAWQAFSLAEALDLVLGSHPHPAAEGIVVMWDASRLVYDVIPSSEWTEAAREVLREEGRPTLIMTASEVGAFKTWLMSGPEGGKICDVVSENLPAGE